MRYSQEMPLLYSHVIGNHTTFAKIVGLIVVIMQKKIILLKENNRCVLFHNSSPKTASAVFLFYCTNLLYFNQENI